MSRYTCRPFWVYLLIFFASQLSAAVFPLVLPRSIEPGTMLSLALFFANALMVALFLWLKPRVVTLSQTAKALRQPSRRRTLIIFLTALPLVCLVNLAQEVLLTNLPDLVGDDQFKAIMFNPIGLFTVAILGPIAEELVFRGGVQNSVLIRHPEQGPAIAIALGAAIFSIAHFNPAQMPVALILGALLGFAYWWTGSLAAPMLIHIFNNSSAAIMAFIQPDNDSFVDFLGGTQQAAVAATISVALLALGTTCILAENKKEE